MITQEDREAAGKVFDAIGRESSAKLARLGRGGDGAVTEIIAAHTRASTKPLIEALERVLESVAGNDLFAETTILQALSQHRQESKRG